MLSKAKGDDVELGATLLQNEQKVDLHVPESPGKSWWNLKNVIYTARNRTILNILHTLVC